MEGRQGHQRPRRLGHGAARELRRGAAGRADGRHRRPDDLATAQEIQPVPLRGDGHQVGGRAGDGGGHRSQHRRLPDETRQSRPDRQPLQEPIQRAQPSLQPSHEQVRAPIRGEQGPHPGACATIGLGASPPATLPVGPGSRRFRRPIPASAKRPKPSSSSTWKAVGTAGWAASG